MDMRITHANASRAELRYIDLPEKYDAQVSILKGATITDNSWVLTVSDATWSEIPIEIGHHIYIDATEWGGIVKALSHDSAKHTVTLSGLLWRGMLKTKYVEPPTGEAYYTASGEANTVIAGAVSGLFGDLVQVSTDDTGVNITGSWRYVELHDALEASLEAEGLTLNIAYSTADAAVILSARAITDSSSEIDLSQDYGLPITSTEGRVDDYNHIIALGAGELVDRDIRHVYRLDDGTITSSAPAWVGTEHDIVTIYDYNNPETVDDLIDGASDLLIDYAPQNGVEIDPSDYDIDLPLADIVGASDRLIGLSATARVIGKVLTISKNGVKIDTKVG